MDAVALLTKMLGERGISAPLPPLVAGAILELAAGEKVSLQNRAYRGRVPRLVAIA